jgi:epoxyqueuosine reductase
MNRLDAKIREQLESCGFEYRVVNISHLPELLETIHKLEREGAVDKQVITNYFKYITDTSGKPVDAKTIFIIAMPETLTRISFTLADRVLQTVIPPTYIGAQDDSRAKEALSNVLSPEGYKIVRARLPLKTLAVRSGLAIYRKNNLAYIPSMGSFFRLIAFYSDYPVEKDDWQTNKTTGVCEFCSKCVENCPTKCIDTDRFLVHAERCLTFLNENEGDFPKWAPPGFHNSLVGCMRCQDVCPVNKPYIRRIKNGPVFSEKETNLILEKTPFKDLPPETQKKLTDIGYEETWLYGLLARNLRVLIKK